MLFISMIQALALKQMEFQHSTLANIPAAAYPWWVC